MSRDREPTDRVGATHDCTPVREGGKRLIALLGHDGIHDCLTSPAIACRALELGLTMRRPLGQKIFIRSDNIPWSTSCSLEVSLPEPKGAASRM